MQATESRVVVLPLSHFYSVTPYSYDQRNRILSRSEVFPMRHMRHVLLAIALFLLVRTLASAEPPVVPPTTRIQVTLEGAAKYPGSQTPAQALVVELNRSHGVLEPVVEAAARTVNNSDYQGRLLRASLTNSELQFTTVLA
jgi:hypothetical protein